MAAENISQNVLAPSSVVFKIILSKHPQGITDRVAHSGKCTVVLVSQVMASMCPCSGMGWVKVFVFVNILRNERFKIVTRI